MLYILCFWEYNINIIWNRESKRGDIMRNKKTNLSPKPAFGSIEQNKIIRAINEGKENPVTDTKEAIRFYEDVMREKEFCKKKYGEAPVFACVEPDEYEEALLMQIVPDDLKQSLGIK